MKLLQYSIALYLKGVFSPRFRRLFTLATIALYALFYLVLPDFLKGWAIVDSVMSIAWWMYWEIDSIRNKRSYASKYHYTIIRFNHIIKYKHPNLTR